VREELKFAQLEMTGKGKQAGIGAGMPGVGETVEQLVAKTDVKGRARAKAAGLTGRVKDSTVQVRARAAERGAGMRGRVVGTALLIWGAERPDQAVMGVLLWARPSAMGGSAAGRADAANWLGGRPG
jgi:hypothetical protein